MQYYVPQFIESESQVIGPLSLKQFLLLAIPATIVILLYFILKSFLISLILGAILIGGGVAFAFFKFQGQDLLSVFNYGIMYLLKPKKYFWAKKGEETVLLKEREKIEEKREVSMPLKRTGESKLRKLSWQLETQPFEEIKEEYKTELEPVELNQEKGGLKNSF